MKLIRNCALLFFCVFLAGLSGAAAQSAEEGPIFALINRERVKARLSPLEWDDRAAGIARNYSRQMAREGFFGHHDGAGRSVVERATRIRWTKIGENLFMGDPIQNFEAFAVKGWMRSPSHRSNILDREWTSTGIGIYRAHDERIFVTQVFLTR